MMIDDLIGRVTSYTRLPETETVLTSAYEIAEKVHRGFQRLNGEPVISHPLEVATILAEWHGPLPVVATGLLHDVHSPDSSHRYDHNDVKLSMAVQMITV